MDTALGLLEIKTYIGACLDKNDIMSCRGVSFEWREAFTPFFWRVAHCELSKPLPPSFTSNKHLIRELSMSQISPQEIYELPNGSFQKLRGLHVVGTQNSRARPRRTHPRRRLPRFIREQCSTLQSLTITDAWIARSVLFWDAVASTCRGLQSLKLTLSEYTSPDHLQRMWKAVCKTGVLELSLRRGVYRRRTISWDMVGEEMVSKVQRLHLCLCHLPDDFIQELIFACPAVQHLSVDRSTILESRAFKDGLQLGGWPQFRVLESVSERVDCDDASEIIQGMAAIQELRLPYGGFGLGAFRCLQEHAQGMSRVQVLELGYSSQLTSSMVLQILEDCCNLVELTAPELNRADIISGEKQWGCASTLQKLRVVIKPCYDIDALRLLGSIGEQIRAVLGRISVLKELRSLDIDMPLTLACGLDQTHSLTKLREVKLVRSARWMTITDLEWILDHWPGLRHTTICAGTMLEVSAEIKARLDCRGIVLLVGVGSDA